MEALCYRGQHGMRQLFRLANQLYMHTYLQTAHVRGILSAINVKIVNVCA